MAELTKVRIDKWLWSVRVFKSRTMASDACVRGKVKVEDKSVKPSYSVSVGEKVNVSKGDLTLIYEATKLIEKRVGAKLAVECYIDHSPPPPPKKRKLDSAFLQLPTAHREKGMGRPTKKERRDIDKALDW